MKNENLIKIFIVIFLIFIPSIIVSYYSAFHIISKDGFEIMKSSLMNNFGEALLYVLWTYGYKKRSNCTYQSNNK